MIRGSFISNHWGYDMNKAAQCWIAEFIGTFALCFVGIAAIFHLGNVPGGLVGIALAHGLTIAVMASATAAISGGHLNPAVTIGLYAARKIDAPLAGVYIIAQLVGAVTAAAILLPVLGQDAIAGGTPALQEINGEEVGPWTGIVIEAILTFFLVFVIYGTAVDKRAPQVGGLFIGLTVALDILAGGPITGAAMNPARHFGPAVLSGSVVMKEQIWLYWIGPALGGVVAALVYRYTLEKSD